MKARAIFILPVLTIISISVVAQRAYTKNGAISFFSKAPIENISAENNQVMSVLSIPTGDLQFSVLVNAFYFKKNLMEVHFNENYMESNKYPKAIFKGKIADMSKVNLTADGTYPVQVSGDLTMHGVTNKVTIPATISVKGGIATGTSKFQVRLADYKISIPKIMKDNIAEVVDVSVSCVYDQKI